MAYLNVHEIESALANLAAAYPTMATLLPTPHATHEGRKTHVLRIGTQVASPGGVLMLGGIHAREWVPPDALISLAADLLEAYELGAGLVYGGKRFSSDDVRVVIESLTIYIYPCVNPDGRHYSQTSEPMWRKNRRPHANGGNCVGVDLNRNFDFLWEHLSKFAPDTVNTSADPCDFSVFRGPAAASEPESQNVVWLLDTYPNIRWHIDVHSAVPVILYSWGSDQNQTSDPNQNFRNLAFDGVRGRKDDNAYREFILPKDLDAVIALSQHMNDAVMAVRGDNYSPEQAFGLYATSGASDDYAFSRHFVDPARTKVYGFTIECGHHFQPPWSEAESIILEVSAALIEFCLHAATSADHS